MKKSVIIKILLPVIVLFFTGCGADYKIEFTEGDDQLNIMVNEQLLATYMYGEDLSKPFLYPVHSPSGVMVTRSFPLREIEGESQDHLHHTGIFFTYGNGEVNGNTFWGNRDVPPRTGDSRYPQIRQVELIEMAGRKGYGKLETLSHWVDTANKPLLKEERLMEFHASENQYTMDFTIHLSALDRTVTFEDTKEGMFAIRVADWLAEGNSKSKIEGTGEYLNAKGEKTEKGVWGKRSSWVRLEGNKEGKSIGITIFHHPQSVNYPTYWHARGYGCFAANPIGQYDYQKGRGMENPQHRTYTLKPGESGLFKFRMIIYDGSRTKEQLDQEFERFSKD